LLVETLNTLTTSLVTGGAGFIGAHISRELIKLGHRIVVLDDLSGGFEQNIPQQAVFVKGSVLDEAMLAALFKEHQFDYVYHLAAYAAEGLSHFIRRFNYNNNLIGSVNLINESVKHKVKTFVFTSSIAVYGKGQLPMHEDLVPSPEDPYGIAKLAVEQDLKCAHEMFGLDYIVFRPHNVYGEFQNLGDKYRNVVGIFMNQLMQGQPLTIFGDGGQTRAFSYIGDIAPVIATSVSVRGAKNEIFNVGADTGFTVNELAIAVFKALGKKTNIRHLDARNEVMHAHASHEKVKSVFGSIPSTSLEEGLRKMAEWALSAGSRKGTKFSNIEITEQLPPIWLE
jgi:UDP-glucose 4-epimerase